MGLNTDDDTDESLTIQTIQRIQMITPIQSPLLFLNTDEVVYNIITMMGSSTSRNERATVSYTAFGAVAPAATHRRNNLFSHMVRPIFVLLMTPSIQRSVIVSRQHPQTCEDLGGFFMSFIQTHYTDGAIQTISRILNSTQNSPNRPYRDEILIA